MRVGDSTDRRWQAKAALLVLMLAAGAARGQDAGQDDDVLDWLAGAPPAQAAPQAPAPTPPPEQEPPEQEPPATPPQPAEPAAQAAPPAADDGLLDWLSGAVSAPPPSELVPPPGPATPPAPRPVSGGRPSPAAVAFAEQLKAAMTLEVQVQDYENSTDLGMEQHPDTLQGYKKQRWQRMQKDKEVFRQRAGQMSLQGLDLPRPAPGVQLSRDAATLMAALQRGYESTRDKRPLEQYMELNKTFYTNADWTQRDRAVLLRDEIVEREVSFSRLLQDAATVAGGGADEQLLADMTETLDRVAPEARVGGDDLAVLVLKDKAMRESVMAEVTAILTTKSAPAAPPAPDEELRPKIAELSTQLIEKAGLAPVVKEHSAMGYALRDLDTQLETDLPMDRKKDLLDKRTKVVKRSAELEQQWYSTAPDAETFDALTETQDELIRRRLLDLGPAGVLYGQRAATTHAKLEAGLPDSASSWRFVQQQQDLLTVLDGVNPQQNPLLGVTMPDQLGAMLMQDAALRVAQEQKIVAQSAPKPQVKKKGGGGGGAQKAAPKPKPKAKKYKKQPMPKYKKPPPKKGKGKKK